MDRKQKRKLVKRWKARQEAKVQEDRRLKQQEAENAQGNGI